MKCGLRDAGVYHKFVIDKAFTRRKKVVKILPNFKLKS